MNNLFEYSDSLNHPFEAFTHVTCRDNFPILPHWHYFIEIIYVTKGKISATCDNYVYNLFPGDLIIFCPQKLHAIWALYDENARAGFQKKHSAKNIPLSNQGTDARINLEHNSIFPISHLNEASDNIPEVEYKVIKFDLNFVSGMNNFRTQFSTALSSAFQISPENLYFSSKIITQYSLDKIVKECINEMNCQKYGYNVVTNALVANLLTYLMRAWQKKGLPLDEIIHKSSANNESFDNITNYIEKHYNENLLVNELAKMCNMSYSYFAKLFRETYNQSCKEYIEFIRLNKVMDLLKFTSFDLTYISQETGFSDCSHLIRIFRKKMGTTPKKWRNSCQKK